MSTADGPSRRRVAKSMADFRDANGNAPSAPERRAERGGVIDASRARAYREALRLEAASDLAAAGAADDGGGGGGGNGSASASTPAEIWAALPLEEQRRRARARGMRISDMEDEASMTMALAVSDVVWSV